MNTPTPRTDTEEYPEGEGQSFQVVSADFARTLERELAHERERSRLLLAAMNERDDGYIESRKRMSALESALNAEREKVQAMRLACERIVEQWDKNHDAAPFHAGNVMYSWACGALATTEDTP
jgi:triphosphoribosyl-dephospho-CoA synthetase